ARRGRRRWTFGLVAVGASAAAVAAFAAVPSSGHRSGGRARLVSAYTVLDRAALAAERRPFTPPRPDQWVMTEDKSVADEISSGKFRLPDVFRSWARVDGTQWATWDAKAKKVQVQRFPALVQSTDKTYAEIARLPTDPDALIASLSPRRPGPARALPPMYRWRTVQSSLIRILEQSTPPPAVQSAIYRALKKVPSAKVDTAAKDPVGRPAIQLNWSFEERFRSDLLLDPSTYAYLGSRTIALKPMTRHRDTGTVVLPAGTVLLASVRIRAGIVDEPGQLPG
ncbi:hypothetical protein DZF91_23885, partial [Actinomadura logoneensis]